MEELKDYLTKTKKIREKSKIIAKNLVKEYTNSDIKFFQINNSQKSAFPSISPKRFQEFEKSLSVKLKEIYEPNHNSSISNNAKSLHIKTKNEVYKLVYMNKESLKYRRPKIMLPEKKEKFENFIAKSILGGRYLSNIVKDPLSPCHKIVKNEEKRSKSELKQLYLVPILKQREEKQAYILA